MLKILRQIENISACRDRDILAASVVAGIREAFPAKEVVLLRLENHHATSGELIARADASGLNVVAGDDFENPEMATIPTELAEAFSQGASACVQTSAGMVCGLPIDPGPGSAAGALVIALDHALSTEEWESLERFARFYINYIRLLDDSEQDTLTQLYNRKTFDESFYRLLTDDRHMPPPGDQAERRDAEEGHEEKQHWLAVADIDFFKKVNDTYGHLFGDEVLIRFAALMKKTFRRNDRLFRFGGEEFVILLKPSTKTQIYRILDRFRCAVEAYDFPRVGKVTCSLGFAPINQLLATTDILGQADTALYYSKANGRNQINNYCDLLEQGLVTAPQAAENNQPNDIDELFL